MHNKWYFQKKFCAFLMGNEDRFVFVFNSDKFRDCIKFWYARSFRIFVISSIVQTLTKFFNVSVQDLPSLINIWPSNLILKIFNFDLFTSDTFYMNVYWKILTIFVLICNLRIYDTLCWHIFCLNNTIFSSLQIFTEIML